MFCKLTINQVDYDISDEQGSPPSLTGRLTEDIEVYGELDELGDLVKKEVIKALKATLESNRMYSLRLVRDAQVAIEKSEKVQKGLK